MSGIAGIVYADSSSRIDPSSLARMAHSLDSAGAPGTHAETRSITEGGVGFAVRADRPGDGGVARRTIEGEISFLAYSGRFYPGCRLEDGGAEEDSTAAWLLQAYLGRGIQFLEELRGDFAIAIWDGRAREAHLATDRFRIRSLVAYSDSEKLLFASRLRAIPNSGLPIQRTIRHDSVVDVLASSYIASPHTIFNEFTKIPPGSVLSDRSGNRLLRTYWDLDYLHPSPLGVRELEADVRLCLEDSIRCRVESERDHARIGTFLSGGIDSSTVTGVLGTLLRRPVESFTIGFAEQEWNEMEYARLAARTFGCQHREYFVSAEDTAAVVDLLVDCFDEPYANASAVPTYFCARLARSHGIDVMYAGDGGDELFAGNSWYGTRRVFEYWTRIPDPLRNRFLAPMIESLAARLPWTVLTRARNYVRRASLPNVARLTSYGFFNVIPMESLFTAEFLRELHPEYRPASMVGDHYLRAPAREELDRQLYVDMKLAICDNDLFKVTRMAGAAGVEVRFPFLDPRLVESATAVPARIKMSGRKVRSFFKQAYADLLPREIREKRKHGFGLPIATWLKSDPTLRARMHDLVLGSPRLTGDYFQPGALANLVARHQDDSTPFFGAILWNVMLLEDWHRRNL